MKSTEDINVMLHVKTKLIYITYAWVNATDWANTHIAQHTTADRHCNINYNLMCLTGCAEIIASRASCFE